MVKEDRTKRVDPGRKSRWGNLTEFVPRHLVVAGGGYVGLATATGFARRGHMVDLIEIDESRANQLSDGRLPFEEPSLADAFVNELCSGRIKIQLGYDTRLDNVDFAFICTSTPPHEDGHLDDTSVYASAEALIESCGTPLRLVVRSTVSPGTTRSLETWVKSRHSTVDVLFNPEFLREGSALHDFESPTRIVVGGRSPAAVADLCGIFDFAEVQHFTTDVTTAEIIKLGANAVLAVRVSMANEIAHLAEGLGADVETVLNGIGVDRRIGRDYLQPGIGFGGSCLPKDLGAFLTSASRNGIPTAVFRGAQRTNDVALERLVERSKHILADVDDARVCVVGVSFKPASDSVRSSQAMALVRALLREGLRVVIHDPRAEANARAELGSSVDYAESLEDGLSQADLGIVIDASYVDAAMSERIADFRLVDSLGRKFPRSATVENKAQHLKTTFA